MSAFTRGIYDDVPERHYHSGAFGPAEGSISSSEAKLILESPAHLSWRRTHPEPPKKAFELGSAVHKLVLGIGQEIYVHDHETLRTKAAREDVEQARENGLIPMKRAEYEEAQEIAGAVLSHPVAGSIFAVGKPERSIYTIDEETGVWMRGRIDWTAILDDATVLVDLKTTRDANPEQWARQAATLDYAVQREWYRMMWAALHPDDQEPRFLHVLVSTTAPHLVSVVEMDLDFEGIGRVKVRRALDTYKRCMDANEWPGYPSIVHRIGPPLWYLTENEDPMEF